MNFAGIYARGCVHVAQFTDADDHSQRASFLFNTPPTSFIAPLVLAGLSTWSASGRKMPHTQWCGGTQAEGEHNQYAIAHQEADDVDGKERASDRPAHRNELHHGYRAPDREHCREGQDDEGSGREANQPRFRKALQESDRATEPVQRSAQASDRDLAPRQEAGKPCAFSSPKASAP